MSVGGGKNKSSSSSTSSAMQQLAADQTPYLQNLWSQGQGLSGTNVTSNQATTAANQYGAQVNGQVYDPLLQNYQNTFGTSNPYSQATSQLTQPLVSGLTDIMNNPGETFGANGSNPLLDNNVAMALQQASTDLSRNLLPQIGRDAQSAGQYGGSRQQIAEGLALSDANQNALQAAMGMYGQQYEGDRAAQLASQQQADATRLGAASQIQQLMGGQVASADQGVTTGQNLANLGMSSANAYSAGNDEQWKQLMNYAQTLGQPIVLGSSTGNSSGKASGGSFSMGI